MIGGKDDGQEADEPLDSEGLPGKEPAKDREEDGLEADDEHGAGGRQRSPRRRQGARQWKGGEWVRGQWVEFGGHTIGSNTM